MGDISLLFDVQREGGVGQGSEATIKSQLQDIVNSINSSPFKIKFQADEKSLNDIKAAVQKITESFGNIRLGNVTVNTDGATKEIANGISQITSNANQAATAVGKVTKSKSNIKTLGTEVETYRAQIDNLIATLERLKGQSANSNALVAIDGMSGDTQRASDAIDFLIQMLRTFKSTVDGDTTVKAFNASLKDLKQKADAVKIAIGEDADVRKRDSQAQKEQLRDTNALSKAIVATNRAYKQATDALQKYTAAKGGRSSKEYADLERASVALKNLNDQLNAGTISEKEYVKQTNILKAQIQQATAIIKANGEAHLALRDKMNLVFKKFGEYFTAAKVIQTVWRAMHQMVQASIELDDAFTQLKIVTGGTDDEMKDFSETAINLAKNLGRSVAEVTKSIETFSRLGYSLPDASVLAEYATILANTAAVDTEAATTGLTSIIKGFNLDVSQAEHIADVLINVGQKYAVSASEMMEAYEKSGAALNATNTSLEKSAGLIAAANASVQNASTVGTALKTVSARIRGSKSDLEELGEDVDDLAQGFSKYANEIQALTGFNIMVDGSTTEFKDLYDIMEGIAAVWDKLSDTQQARVAEILGGTRQLQVIASIIGNWKDAAGAYSDAMNSAGTATEANSVYMDSATAHINQFKASFEALSSDIASSKLITFFVDFANAIVSAVDAFTKLPLPAIATSIATILSFKNVGELINQFQSLIILRIEYAHEAFN